MPKNTETNWSEFLFDCNACPNAEECINEGVCRHEIPSDGDFDVDDNAEVVKEFFEQEVYGSLSTAL